MSDKEYKDRYWLVYDVIKEILNSRGIFDEVLIKAKVEESIKPNNSINKNAFNKE